MKQTENDRPRVPRHFPYDRRRWALWQVVLALGTVLGLISYAMLLRPELSGGQFLTLVLGSLLIGAVWFTANKFASQFFDAREGSDEAQSRLAAIVQSCDDAIIGKTLDGVITTWNAGAENMYGYSEQEVVGRSIALLNPPDRPDEIPDILQMVTQGKGINRYETERIRKDGRRLVVSASVSPIKNPQGIINGASTIARDITQLKIVEEKLRAHASHMETLHSVAQDVGATLSLDEVLERALRRVIGASGFDYAFISFHDGSSLRSHGACAETRMPTPELQTFKDLGDATVEQMPDPNQPWFVEDASTTPLGQAYVAAGMKALAVLPLRRSAQLYGTLTLISAQTRGYSAEHSQFLQALTQQIALAVENASLYGATLQMNRHLEAEIEERKRAEKLLADFTAMVVHDLRSPLSNLASIAESLQEEVFGTVNSQQRQWLGKMRVNCNDLIAHVSEFLDCSKMEAGHIELVKHPVDLFRLLSDSVLEHSIIAGKHLIGLELALQSPLPAVSLDSRRINQVLDNLLSNAIKFTQGGGRIELGAQIIDGDQVKIWVQDTGVGIPQSELVLLFEKYRQVSSSNRSTSLGTGLGLFICTKIVEAHGGAISVESEEKKGTRFTFSLPLGLADARQPVENQLFTL